MKSNIPHASRKEGRRILNVAIVNSCFSCPAAGASGSPLIHQGKGLNRVSFRMRKWLNATRLRLGKCRCRLLTTVFTSFVLLTLFFVCDRSYLESAMIALDDRFTPFVPSNKNVDDGATTAAGIIIPPLTFPRTVSAETRPPLFPGCNIFDGKWVYDDAYPLYTNCHLAEDDFQCHTNGRPDMSYQKWRWQPHECSIPRFDARDMLARLKGLRVVFVGDSMGRTQWESLNCLLLQGASRKPSVEMVGGPITKLKHYIGTRFNDDDVAIDYYRSPYLIFEGPNVPKGSPKRVRSTLNLKKVDNSVTKELVKADVLLLNTGHWWTTTKTYDIGCYFQLDNKVALGMPVMDAYKKAMNTITSWVDDHVNFSRTEVFFRSYEPPHWELPMATKPNISQPEDYPRTTILKEAVGKMQSPAAILDVTSLSSYRPDGHVFNWTGSTIVDCAHWCLPGVPDAWNELLYASLLLRGRGVWSAKNSSP